jgi:hypothetical protein
MFEYFNVVISVEYLKFSFQIRFDQVTNKLITISSILFIDFYMIKGINKIVFFFGNLIMIFGHF